jgi:peroxiredoxin
MASVVTPSVIRHPRRVLAPMALALLLLSPGLGRTESAATSVGYIRTRYQKFEVSLLAAKPVPGSSGKALNIPSVDGRAPVPPGEYYISNWMVAADDAEGHHWYAKGNMLPDPITVRAGEETRVRLAEPLQAHLIVFGAQDPIGFRLELTGPHGERCREIRRDGQSMPQPRLEILDDKGRLVVRFPFIGRCGGTCLTTWAAPPQLKGRFTALISADFGGGIPVEVGAGTSFRLESSRLSMPKAAVGSPAPEFALTAADATLNQLSFMRGKPVLLSFFCSCDLCRAVATEMGKHPEIAKRARVFAVFSDPSYAETSVAEAFQKETGYPGRLLLDLAANVTLQYQSPECPHLWVIDGTGIARYSTPDPHAPASKIVADAIAALGR